MSRRYLRVTAFGASCSSFLIGVPCQVWSRCWPSRLENQEGRWSLVTMTREVRSASTHCGDPTTTGRAPAGTRTVPSTTDHHRGAPTPWAARSSQMAAGLSPALRPPKDSRNTPGLRGPASRSMRSRWPRRERSPGVSGGMTATATEPSVRVRILARRAGRSASAPVTSPSGSATQLVAAAAMGTSVAGPSIPSPARQAPSTLRSGSSCDTALQLSG